VTDKGKSGFWRGWVEIWEEESASLGYKWILGLVFFAFLIRIPLLLFPEVIHNDGTEYIRHARQILSGDWSIGTGRTHPLYPSLIALAHFFSPNDEMAGIGISVMFGALIVLPIFYLGRAVFSEKVGFLSALFATVHPPLYIYSGSVLTESVFYFLLANSVLFGWKAFEKGQWRDSFLFGFFTSLSYLIRVEGIGLLAIFGVWVLLINPRNGSRPWIKRGRMLLLAILSFLIFSAPYLIQIKTETGRWQISKKISISMGSFSEEESEQAVERIRERGRITISSLLKSPLTLVKKIGIGGVQSLYLFQQVFTPYLLLMAVLGVLSSRTRPYPIKGNLYLLSHLVYFLCFIHPLFRAGRRYASHVIPFALPWAAFGFFEIIYWIHRMLRKETLRKKVPTVLLVVILTVLFIQGRVIHQREHRFIQREAGLWLKEHLPRGSKLMSRLPQEAFYGELEWVRMPLGSYEEILKEARSKGTQYVLIDKEIVKKSPDFLEKMSHTDFDLLKELERGDRSIKVFHLRFP